MTGFDPNGNIIAWFNDNGDLNTIATGQLTCSGDCPMFSFSASVNGGSASQISLLLPSTVATSTTNNLPNVTAVPHVAPPLKQGCLSPAVAAGVKAAYNDFFKLSGGEPAGDIRGKDAQRAAAGALIVAANSAKSLAPAFDLFARVVPYVGEGVLTVQGYGAAKAGVAAFKDTGGLCYSHP